MTNSHHIVPEDKHGIRLDVFLAEERQESRSQIQKYLDQGAITVNNAAPKKAGQRLITGSTIIVSPKKLMTPVTKKDVRDHDTSYYDHIRVLREAPEYLVVFKPAGLLVHPTQAHEPVALTNWLLLHYPDVRGVGESSERPGIVHRLDRDASGVLVIARTPEMFSHLKAQFQARLILKEYRVLVHGVVEKDVDQIDFDIDRGKEGRMVARPKIKEVTLDTVDDMQSGKSALTEFSVIERFARHTLLNVRIHSGRTHQIRVHMFAYAHPVVGDTIYFNKKFFKKSDIPINRLFLHAWKLQFATIDNENICVEVPLPDELQDYIHNIT